MSGRPHLYLHDGAAASIAAAIQLHTNLSLTVSDPSPTANTSIAISLVGGQRYDPSGAARHECAGRTASVYGLKLLRSSSSCDERARRATSLLHASVKRLQRPLSPHACGDLIQCGRTRGTWPEHLPRLTPRMEDEWEGLPNKLGRSAKPSPMGFTYPCTIGKPRRKFVTSSATSLTIQWGGELQMETVPKWYAKCDAVAPATETDFTLISNRHAWRWLKRVDSTVQRAEATAKSDATSGMGRQAPCPT